MTVFLPLLLGLGQGLLHAVGPDHVAAMVTLSSSGERRRRAAFMMALRFALGHAAVLGAVAGVSLLAGIGLSETFERWTEIAGGGVLVALALTALIFPHALAHGHPHFGGHGADHRHERIPLAAGALMAFSGVRSLLLAVPPLIIGGSMSLSAWTFLPGFTLGVLLGMGAVGWVLSEGLSRMSTGLAHWIQRTAAVASAALGVFWISSRL